MGHISVVSNYPKSIGIPRVDGWSTDPWVLGHHKIYMSYISISAITTYKLYYFTIYVI